VTKSNPGEKPYKAFKDLSFKDNDLSRILKSSLKSTLERPGKKDLDPKRP